MDDHREFGLALGSGGARGAAHTGVLKVLAREKLAASFVAGSSIGALIGAAYAAGIPLARMEDEWRATGIPQVVRGLLPTFPRSGLSSGRELRKLLKGLFGDIRIEQLPIPFAAIACDIDTGEAVVLREGSLVDALRASTAIPGLFHPVRWGDRVLVDGGMVDPVPVSTCREIGAGFVVAVDITPKPVPTTQRGITVWNRIGTHLHEGLSHQTWIPGNLTELLDATFRERPERPLPGVYSIINQSISILLQEILRLKLSIDAPDVLIRPAVAHSTLGFHHAREGIEAGIRAAEDALPELRRRLATRAATGGPVETVATPDASGHDPKKVVP